MKKVYCKYISALLLFGTNGIVASHIALTSYEIVLLRTFIGSIFLLTIYKCTGHHFTFYSKKRAFLFLALSGIAMGTSWMFLYEAYRQIGVSISSLLYYCGPIIVVLLSPFLFREKLSIHKIGGFTAVLCGLFLVNGFLIDRNSFPGIFCGCMSAIMYAFMVIFNKKASSITGLENAALQLTFSFLTVAAFTVSTQGFHITIPQDAWFPLLLLGIVNTGIGCYLYFSSIAPLPVQTVTICGYLEPLSAVLFAALLLHESLHSLQIVGAILIIGGAIYTEYNSLLFHTQKHNSSSQNRHDMIK